MLTTNEIIGKNILNILNERGMEQIQLAKRLEVTKETLNKIIHGRRNITIDEMRKICDILSVFMERLTNEDDLKEGQLEPIKYFMAKINSKEAKCGLMHAQKIMDMLLFHSEIQEKRLVLGKAWDD